MNSRRRIMGTVTSDKMDKTVVVEIKRSYRHPLLGKVVHDLKRVKAHDENNACKIGDKVMLVETRPISTRETPALSVSAWISPRILRS